MKKNRRIRAGWNLESDQEPDVIDHLVAMVVSAVVIIMGFTAMWLVTLALTT